MRKTRVAVAIASLFPGLAAGGFSAQAAGPATTAMQVSVEILPNCTVTAEPLAFGAVTAADAPARATTASIEVACGPEVSFSVALDDGQNGGGGTRRALDPATGAYLAYDIFADAAHTQRWGATGTGAVPGVTSAQGTAQLTAYGLVGSETQAAAGRYADVVTVTTGF